MRLVAHHRSREIVRSALTLPGQAVQLRSAGVRQANELGHLVEALAGGVVHRAAEDAMLERRSDVDEHGVASTDYE